MILFDDFSQMIFNRITFGLHEIRHLKSIKSIGHRYLWVFYIFFVTGGFLPNTRARPLRLTIRWTNFWPLRKNWSAVLNVRTASIEISSNQKKLSLVNMEREVACPISYFLNMFWLVLQHKAVHCHEAKLLCVFCPSILVVFVSTLGWILLIVVGSDHQ